MSDAAQQEPGGAARGVEVTDNDRRRWTKMLLQAAAKSLTQPKRSPRHVWTGAYNRSRPLPNRIFGGKHSYCTRKGRRCERTGATTADAHASYN
jgi:hypothetical protein